MADDRVLARHFGESYRLKVTDIIDPGPNAVTDERHIGDLADAAFVKGLFADGSVRAVIHMAGYPREADWGILLDANIRSTINLWEIARESGVERMLYASSNHAIGFYPRSQRIDDKVPTRPDSRYGLTKAFGEQIGFLYAYKFGLRFFGMRIGMFSLPEPTTHRGLATWLSPRDMLQLATVGLTSEYTCEIVYGVSNNSRSFWDNSAAHRLGYAPQDSADAYSERFAQPDDPPGSPSGHFQGGPYIKDGLASSSVQRAELDRC